MMRGTEFGGSNIGAGLKVNGGNVRANRTGAMHVGQTRGGVFGEALARLLAFSGWDVTR